MSGVTIVGAIDTPPCLPMLIDGHQHFWVYNSDEYGWIDDSMAMLRRDFLPVDLVPELDLNEAVGSVVVQTRQTLQETRWLLQLADRNPFVLGVVGWVNLRAPDLRSQLAEFAKNPKLVGIRHIVQSEPDDSFLVRDDFLKGIALLEEFDLAYDILIYTKHLPVAAEFVSKFPRHRFVLDHAAKPPIRSREMELWEAGIRNLAAFPNVSCKVSGLVTEADWKSWKADDIRPYLDVTFECFGPKRLIVGSDWPVCLVASSYERVIKTVRNYLTSYPPEVQRAILGDNARSFWRLRV